MAIPTITPSTTTRAQAISDLLVSIALEETAISSILNAQGQSIQTVSQMPGVTADQILAINNSARSMINLSSLLEIVLQGSIDLLTSAISNA